ncbi:MAG: hypothetical protein ABSH16_03235 [Sedimentisphaerales bacterium]
MFRASVVVWITLFMAATAYSAVPIEPLSHIGRQQYSYSIAVDGNYAYWGTGSMDWPESGGLVIFDISQPSRPAQISRVDTGGDVVGIAIRDNFVYTTGYTVNGAALSIIDISDKAKPHIVGQCYMSSACEVALDGNFAYVADGEECLRVVDISNPNQPVIIASCKPNDGYIFAHHIAIANSIAYLTDEEFKKLYIIDISQPSNPTLLTTYYSQYDTHGITIRDNYVYLANSVAGLTIIDVSNPNEPNTIAVCDTPGWAYGVALSGDNAIVSDAISDNSYFGWVNLIDIYNPCHPFLLSSYQTGRYSYRVAVQDNFAYVVNRERGFDVIDFSAPFDLSLKGRFIMSHAARGVNITGSIACLVDEYTGTSFFDISNPSAPACFGGYDPYPDYGGWEEYTPFGVSSVITEENAFIGWGSMVDKLQITNPVNPVYEHMGGFYDTISKMKFENNILYAATSAGLEMTDTSFNYLGLYAANEPALNFVKKENKAYIANGSSGLKIIDVSNPSGPVLLGSCDTNGPAYGVDVAGSVAVVADYNAGVKTIDVCDPCNPSIIGSCPTPDLAMDVAVSGKLACIANANSGLQVVSLSNPAQPNIVASYDPPGSTKQLAVNGKIAVLADGSGGFQVVRIGSVADLEPDGDVDMDDLMQFCMNWLRCDCEKPFGCNNADINNDQKIDFADFALFAAQWQEKP